METRWEVSSFRGLDIGQLSNCCQAGSSCPSQPFPTVMQLRGCRLIFTGTAPAALCITCAQQNGGWTKLELEHPTLGSEASLSCLHTAVTWVQEHLLISSRPDSAGLLCLNTLKFWMQKAQKSAEFHSKLLTEELQVPFYSTTSSKVVHMHMSFLQASQSLAQAFHCSRVS